MDVAPDQDAARLRLVLAPQDTPASRLLLPRRLAVLPPGAGAAVRPAYEMVASVQQQQQTMQLNEQSPLSRRSSRPPPDTGCTRLHMTPSF